MKKHACSVTITRNSSDVVRIAIQDEESRVKVAMVEMTPHDFAMALTGLSEVGASVEYGALANVGKRRVVEKRSATCPLKTYDKAELAAWLRENCREEGWAIDPYLGSQGSVVSLPGEGLRLNYRVVKFVDLAE